MSALNTLTLNELLEALIKASATDTLVANSKGAMSHGQEVLDLVVEIKRRFSLPCPSCGYEDR